MDHQSPDILPSVELPSPQQGPQAHELALDKDYNEQHDAQRLEQVVPQSPAPTIQDPITQQASAVIGQIVAPHDAPPAGTTGVMATPQIADDGDLIEKEWVDRAKRIVEHTRHDPHQQNKEMNSMKADYLKKRYNKDIKQSE